MAGYGRKGYKRSSRKIVKKRTSGTSSRRKLQGMNKATRRAVNFVTGMVPVAKTAYNLYNFAKSARKPGSRVRPMAKDKGTGGYNQWSQRYAAAKFGKLTSRKIDSMSMSKTILVHQRIGPFNDNGQVYMSNFTDSSGVKYYPLFLFELNSTNNFVSGTHSFVTPVYQMLQRTTNDIGWYAHNAQNPDGAVGGSHWLVERSAHQATSSIAHPMSQAIHQWSALDLELWGATQKPTKYSIQLCQFNEDVMPPDLIAGNQVYFGDVTDKNACEFWQSLVKHYSYSPLAKMDDGFNRKKIKVLKTYTINIDPTANYENDPDPHVKTMKLFYRFNRKCNFQWKYSNAAPQSAANMQDADWHQEDGELQCRVHPNARLFVMIRASNYTPITAPAVATNTTNPSISWRLRSSYLLSQ